MATTDTNPHRRVLLVDDCATLRSLVRSALEHDAIGVQLATNGLEAIAYALMAQQDGEPYDLVLMDVVMPFLTGIDATWRLRRLGYEGPIVILTANDGKFDMASALCAGADDYLPKPFTPEDLQRVIETHCPVPA